MTQTKWTSNIENMLERKPHRLPSIARNPLAVTQNILRQRQKEAEKIGSPRGVLEPRSPRQITVPIFIPQTLNSIRAASVTRDELWHVVPNDLTMTYLNTWQRAEDYNRRQMIREEGAARRHFDDVAEELLVLLEAFNECVCELESNEEHMRSDLADEERVFFRNIKKRKKKEFLSLHRAEIYIPPCPLLTKDTALYLDNALCSKMRIEIIVSSRHALQASIVGLDDNEDIVEVSTPEDTFDLKLSASNRNISHFLLLVSGMALSDLKYGWVILKEDNGTERYSREITQGGAGFYALRFIRRGPSWLLRGESRRLLDLVPPLWGSRPDSFYTYTWELYESTMRHHIESLALATLPRM